MALAFCRPWRDSFGRWRTFPTDKSVGYFRSSLRDSFGRWRTFPTDKSVGYFRSSLRDLETKLRQFLEILDLAVAISRWIGTVCATPKRVALVYVRRRILRSVRASGSKE